MHAFILGAVAALILPSGTAAQSNSGGSTEKVLSSFVYALHGERTPPGPDSQPSLTSLGAQQLYSQGSFLKSRYLSGSSGNGTDGSASHPISNIDDKALFTSQLSVSTSTDDWVFGSALAFTQGLYPPVTQVFAQGNGVANSSYLANGTLVVFPLDGYQYPNIRTLSILDPSSIWLQGEVACSNYVTAESETNDDFIYNQTQAMYQSIFDEVFPGAFPESMINSNYAFNLWEYAAYQYNHNETVRSMLSGAKLALLRQLADVQQFDINANLTASPSQPDGNISPIAGRTLAAQIVSRFSSFIQSGGYSDKLTLTFGSFEPFLALFALLELAGSQPDRLFTRIPDPGAIMVFELYSVSQVNNTQVSSEDDLRVRFLYRNGTSDGAALLEYPLFGMTGYGPDLSFADFSAAVSQFAVKDLSQWCSMCSAITLFCTGINAIGGGAGAGASNLPSLETGGNRGGPLSPTAAGLVGAACSIGVLLLAGAAAAIFGGFRVRRNTDSIVGGKASGGYKGNARLEDDQDVSLAKNGTAHARTGSWELGKGGAARAATTRLDEAVSPVTPVDRAGQDVFGASFVRRRDGDADSVLGVSPVRPAEGV
ncbi:histidine phosphatase superfamily [Microdochium trichocladiopsis]|uniref:Histidine phosphatase superfamily n=1 Tax=Microdochium trichocladiopsis TaxID=1682393 RepID=A0A9P8YH67_9PEZI|nr:histidine phosphatase superfamily [Microdochium trichocladiopsis]KAH7039873.1 histidine phosphatase superfamily [Microdochium trichocladiopsis]